MHTVLDSAALEHRTPNTRRHCAEATGASWAVGQTIRLYLSEAELY